MNFADKWMELEDIILSEVTQSQKNKRQMVSLIWGCQRQQPSCKYFFWRRMHIKRTTTERLHQKSD